ncbi:MAG TPA: hypothetical protein VMW80_00085 [Candidatus Dormibacteraeota bacterium]|nr:hypothetical protein [Candidatus Dormibacteraeota bacterium]
MNRFLTAASATLALGGALAVTGCAGTAPGGPGPQATISPSCHGSWAPAPGRYVRYRLWLNDPGALLGSFTDVYGTTVTENWPANHPSYLTWAALDKRGQIIVNQRDWIAAIPDLAPGHWETVEEPGTGWLAPSQSFASYSLTNAKGIVVSCSLPQGPS